MWFRSLVAVALALFALVVFNSLGVFAAEEVPPTYRGYDTKQWVEESIKNKSPVTLAKLDEHLIAIKWISPVPVQQGIWSRITFYDCSRSGFCGRMANGEYVHAGAAACDVRRLGQRFILHGRTFTCKDTGRFGGNHVDIFFYNYYDGVAFIRQYGDYGYVYW